jgi:hypothetical protein
MNVVLPLPPGIGRSVVPDGIWISIEPINDPYLIPALVVDAITYGLICIVMAIGYFFMPDLSYLSICKILVANALVVIVWEIIVRTVFVANLEILIAKEFFIVCKQSYLFMAHFEFIPIGQEFHVLVVYESEAGRRRGIRVSTGEKGLILGESLTPEVQNYLLAEIKDTYTTWRKNSSLKISKQE